MNIPWQDRQGLGIFKAAVDTIKYVLLKPGEFFDNLEIKYSLKEPYLFCVIVSSCTGIISLVVETLFKQGLNLTTIMFGSLIVFAVSLIGIFIGSAIIHLGVMILGGTGGFKGTFNVLAYNASSSVFSVIPFIGGIISGIWGTIVGVKGFKRVHNLTTIRAVLAYLGLFFIVAIIALLAAIAIPNLLRARISASDAAAKATIRTISTAIDSYAAANNGQYPLAEYDLVYASNPPYLSKAYDKQLVSGYRYSLQLGNNGYEVSAVPETCGVSGFYNLKAKSGGIFEEEPCNK